MSNSVRPHRQQPIRLPHPGDSPGRNTGVGCHFLLQCMKVKSEGEVAQSCPTLATPWTAVYQAPPPMGFARQEYWSGLPSLGHKCSFGKFKKIEIIPNIFSDHNAVRLDVNYRRKTIKNSNMWRLNNTLLNNQQITEEIKKEMKIFIETNKT